MRRYMHVHRYVLLAILLVLIAALADEIYRYYQSKNASSEAIVLYGNVDVRQVDLGFRANGRVITMPFQEGDLVTPGTLMAELDKKPYVDQVNQAHATLESIKTNLSYAEKVLKRRQGLFNAGDGSISVEDLENAQSQHDALASNLRAQEAALALAETNLRDTVIYAPSEGTILTRIREPGTVVKESDPVYTLSLTSPIWVRTFIQEPYLGVVYPGMPAEVFTDTENGKVYKGHVGFISPVAEFTPKSVETTQLRSDLVYRLRVVADNPDQGLRQGMPVTVKLYKKPSEGTKDNDRDTGSDK